jgi:hypothetical protein
MRQGRTHCEARLRQAAQFACGRAGAGSGEQGPGGHLADYLQVGRPRVCSGGKRGRLKAVVPRARVPGLRALLHHRIHAALARRGARVSAASAHAP